MKEGCDKLLKLVGQVLPREAYQNKCFWILPIIHWPWRDWIQNWYYTNRSHVLVMALNWSPRTNIDHYGSDEEKLNRSRIWEINWEWGCWVWHSFLLVFFSSTFSATRLDFVTFVPENKKWGRNKIWIMRIRIHKRLFNAMTVLEVLLAVKGCSHHHS